MTVDTQARTEWRGAWPLPFVSAIGYGLAISQIHSFGVFIEPLQKEFGWSRGATSSALTVLSALLVFSPVMGSLIDRWGPRRIAIPGAAAYCCAFALLSQVGPTLWSWWLLWALLGLATLTIQPMTWLSAVASRFDRSRGLAVAIAFCGAGIGAALIPPAAEQLVQLYGWRLAYVALAAGFAIASLPLLILFFRDANDVAGRKPLRETAEPTPAATLQGRTLLEAAKSPRFWKLAIVAFLSVSAITALLVHFVPLMTWKGLARADAARIASLIGLSSIAGRLITGVLLDRINGAIVGAVGFSLPILLALLILSTGPQLMPAMAAAILFGLTLGCEVDALGYLTTRHFGMRSLGAVFGAIIAIESLAVGVGATVAGFVFDFTGSYRPVLLGLIPIFALSALLIATLGRYPDFADTANEHEH